MISARLCLLGMIALGAGSLAVAAPVPKEKRASRDQDLVVGRWRQTTPAGSNCIWVFKADGAAEVIHNPEFRVPAAFKFNPEESPKQMDWELVESHIKFHGAYELDGNRLRFVLRGTSADRPLELKQGTPGIEFYEMERLSD